MLGEKPRAFKTHTAVSLDTLVPQDNFYRQVEAKLDLSFTRDLVKSFYSTGGRPSIDPAVFFKLELIMFFEGIRSERQLMEMVNLRLDHRWYIGYDFGEPVPNHSSLSKIRDRYGLEVFQRFFEKIVELCIAAGLVWGKELYFDGSQVQAQASMDSLVPRVKVHLLSRISKAPHPAPITASGNAGVGDSISRHQSFAEKYTGQRVHGRERPSAYRRITDQKVSTTDPDATLMKPGFAGYARLGYHTHYVVDGGKARIILAALVTPASVMDNTPMLDLTRWARFRWGLQPAIAVGDAKYGTIANLVGLEQDGIRAYIPPHNQERKKNTTRYPQSSFQYDPSLDRYICPQGHPLPLFYTSYTTQVYVYQADGHTCASCLVQIQCKTSSEGRSVSSPFYQAYLDKVEGYQGTAAYRKALRKRQVWVEPLFGEAKQWHRLRQFRLRGMNKVNIEGLITATGQNIKRLLQAKRWQGQPDPGGTMALQRLFLYSSH